MKTLHVQLQPVRSAQLDIQHAVLRLTEVGRRLGISARVTEGFDTVRYVNMDFASSDLTILWTSLREEMQTIEGVAAAAIVCSQGEYGWDDYLLLQHFDPSEPLDTLP